MKMRPSTVLTGWLIANGLLAVILVAFDEHPLAYILYLVATVPLAVFGVAVLLAAPELGARNRIVLLPAGGIILVAAGMTLIGLGLVFVSWIAIVGGVLVVGALLALLRPERER